MQVSVNKKSERKAAYLFIIPAVVLLAAFLLYPALQTVRYAFTDYNIMRPDRIKFCGLNNFIELFQDKDFWIAVKNTLHFTVLVVPFQTVLALALALLISSRRKGVSIFRAAYFSPQVTSMVVVAILWTVLYNSNPSSGLLNALLVNLGMEPCGFLNDPKTAMNSIIFMSAWQGAGYQMMIFLAGLQGIPKDQYEAASIDGAGKIKSFLYVTLPGLKNVISYVIMITVIQAMKLFTQPYVMTKGGPQNATRTLVYYVYEQGFQKRNFGYACAVAAVFFVIVISLSVGMKKIVIMTQKQRKQIGSLAFYIGNTIIALIFVSPLIWMISASLKPEAEIFKGLNSISTFIPKAASLANYQEVFSRINMWKFIFNSLFYVMVIIVLDLFVNSLCGYALAKFEFKGKNALLTLVISLMVFPAEAIMLPMYREMADLGWINTWASLIVPFVAKCFSIYMFRQFFLDIPNDLLEAAKIDGCGPIKTFFRVVVPISGTVYATILILDFVAHWNDFMWPLLVVTGEEKRTVQLAIQTFFGSKPINYGPIMASLTISAIPMLLMFVFLQKYYVEGIASTGIKG